MTPLLLAALVLSVTPMFSVCKPLQSGKLPSLTGEMLDVSEIIAKANRNISTFLTHGDIVPSRNRNADPCTAVGCKWPKTGPYVYVPIEFSNDFPLAESLVIMDGLMGFHKSTCIRFTYRTEETDYLHIFSGDGCWSYVGRQGGKQQLSLQEDGCVYINTVQHEILHALGFHHEQSRSDRDGYINIHLENVEPGQRDNFEKVETNNLNTPYDYDSIMQYNNFAFSSNEQPTITAKTNPNLILGYTTEMSPNDIARVNKLYECQK